MTPAPKKQFQAGRKATVREAKEKFRELKSYQSALKHSIEPSVCIIMGLMQQDHKRMLSEFGSSGQLKEENMRLKNEIEKLQFSLNDARMTASTESKLRMKYERELEDYRRLISLLKELIDSGNNGESKAHSVLGARERELLNSATTLYKPDRDRVNGNTALHPLNKTPDYSSKRHRSYCSDGESSSQAERAIGCSSDDDIRVTAEMRRKSKRRSSIHVVPEETPKQKVVRYEKKYPSSAHVGTINDQFQTPLLTDTPSTTSLDSDSVPNKHCFLKKTNLKNDDCLQCNKKLRFAAEAHKCKNCKFVCHPACKQQALKTKSCPNNVSNGLKSIGSLSQFSPEQPPYVPKVLATIVQEVESRGRTESGIYRIPGTHRVVGDIMDQIARQKVPYLSGHDIHTVCSVMKDFIRRLDEPIVTYRLHDHFMGIADLQPSQASSTIMSLVQELPAVNRDTLAFIMLHLKRVSGWKHCFMGSDNLCKIFGPTLIRHSAASLNNENNQMMVLGESKKHPVVMARLFDMPEYFWSQYLMPPSNGGAQHDTDATSSESDGPRDGGGVGNANHANMYATPVNNHLRRIIEDRQLDSASSDCDTPVLYGPNSVVAHRTRYREVAIKKGGKYFQSPLR